MKTILTSLILLVSLNLFAQEVPEKYQKLWAECHTTERDDALKKLDKLIKKNPNDPWVYWMRGVQTFNGIENGEEYFETALKLDSTFAPAYFSLANCIDATDEISLNKKEYLFTKAIQFCPSDEAYYYIARGEVYLSQKKFDLALKDALNSKEINKEYQIGFNELYVQALNGLNMDKELKQFLFETDVFYGGMAIPDFYLLASTLYEKYNMKSRACEGYKAGLESTESYLDFFETKEEFEKMHGEKIKLFKEKLKACN
ncbi:MAG: hypothetical protein ACK46Y_03375 [Fluviicola sp.]|jgi:tetratricopeptide (TPR) repeat protein